MSDQKGWVGFDLDGTLAYYEDGDIKRLGVCHIGPPIESMVDIAKAHLEAGDEVKIFTARVSILPVPRKLTIAIKTWCLEHLGRVLPITCTKDIHMRLLYDDRAKQVLTNLGVIVGDAPVLPLPAEAAAL